MYRINHPLAVRPAERQSSRRAPSCRRFTLYGNALPEELIGALEPIQLRRLPRRGNGTTERACYSDKLRTQDANGTTTMAYNLLGAMTSLTDPDQNQTVWTRDNLGRVISEQNPSGTETFAYDANSNLAKQVDFDGHERDFVFDDLNRETAEKWMNGATVLNTISTAYNAAGQVTSTDDNYSDYAFGYNGQGDQTSVDNAGTPNAPHVVLTSQFDALGNRKSLAATLNGTADFINNYSYDTLSRLRDITQQGQTGGNAVAPKSIYIGLDGVGDITELNYANTVSAGPQPTNPGYVTLTYSPTTGLLTGINDTANGASIDSLAYTYDALGRVSTFTSIDGTATYGYDNTSQLVSATYTTATGGHQPNNVSFTWDANGNNATPGNVVSPNNEVTNDGTYTYTFDADGNRTSRTNISSVYATDYKTTYTWDYRNRLTDVEYFDNNNVLTKHVHYVYDVYDNLLEEDLDPAGGGTYTTKEQFVLDISAKVPTAGNAPLEHFDAAGNLIPLLPDDVLMELVNNQLTERFLNGPSPSGAADVIYAEGAVASLTQPDSVDWLFANNQGSPTDVVNSSGAIIDHEVYSPFGQVVYASNAGGFVLQGFSGGYADPNTGLIKFGERWYDPMATVWISVDPAGFRAGDVDVTRYLGNDPTEAVDLPGLAGEARPFNPRTDAPVAIYPQPDRGYVPGVTYPLSNGQYGTIQVIDPKGKAIVLLFVVSSNGKKHLGTYQLMCKSTISLGAARGGGTEVKKVTVKQPAPPLTDATPHILPPSKKEPPFEIVVEPEKDPDDGFSLTVKKNGRRIAPLVQLPFDPDKNTPSGVTAGFEICPNEAKK